MYMMDKPTKWKYYLHMVEFTYNDWKQEALGVSPFESLYGRKCKTPINCDGLVNIVIIGLDMLKEMERQMVKIRQSLKEEKKKKR